MSFLSLLSAIGKFFEKGLTFIVQYLPGAATLASLIFPPAAAPLAEAVSVATLLQNAVAMAEQKYAAAGVQSGTGAQKLAEVLEVSSAAVTTLLAQPAVAKALNDAGIVVDSSYITSLVNAVVAILNVQPAPQIPA
jgi:hypothetical protein